MWSKISEVLKRVSECREILNATYDELLDNNNEAESYDLMASTILTEFSGLLLLVNQEVEDSIERIKKRIAVGQIAHGSDLVSKSTQVVPPNVENIELTAAENSSDSTDDVVEQFLGNSFENSSSNDASVMKQPQSVQNNNAMTIENEVEHNLVNDVALNVSVPPNVENYEQTATENSFDFANDADEQFAENSLGNSSSNDNIAMNQPQTVENNNTMTIDNSIEHDLVQAVSLSASVPIINVENDEQTAPENPSDFTNDADELFAENSFENGASNDTIVLNLPQTVENNNTMTIDNAIEQEGHNMLPDFSEEQLVEEVVTEDQNYTISIIVDPDDPEQASIQLLCGNGQNYSLMYDDGTPVTVSPMTIQNDHSYGMNSVHDVSTRRNDQQTSREKVTILENLLVRPPTSNYAQNSEAVPITYAGNNERQLTLTPQENAYISDESIDNGIQSPHSTTTSIFDSGIPARAEAANPADDEPRNNRKNSRTKRMRKQKLEYTEYRESLSGSNESKNLQQNVKKDDSIVENGLIAKKAKITPAKITPTNRRKTTSGSAKIIAEMQSNQKQVRFVAGMMKRHSDGRKSVSGARLNAILHDLQSSTKKNTNKQMFPKNSLYNSLCDLCGKKDRFLASHYARCHPETEVMIARPSPKMAARLRSKSDKFSRKRKTVGLCFFCEEEKSMAKCGWEKHLLTHTGESMFSCSMCSSRIYT